MALLDKIVIAEKRRRFERNRDALSKGIHAAEALEWFAEHVTKRPIADVITVHARFVAAGTDGVNNASEYLEASAKFHAETILETAAEMAHTDFLNAKKLNDIFNQAKNGPSATSQGPSS